MATPLKATIRSIEGDLLQLALEDGQTLRLPLAACEGLPKLGADAYLILAVPGAEDSARGSVAHHILNQLLGSRTHAQT